MSSYRIQQKANLDAIAIAVCSTAAQCFPIMDIIIMMAGCILHQQLQDYGISSADPRDGMIAAASIFLGIQLLCSDAFAIMTAIQLQLELSYAETCISTSGTVSHTVAVHRYITNRLMRQMHMLDQMKQ